MLEQRRAEQSRAKQSKAVAMQRNAKQCKPKKREAKLEKTAQNDAMQIPETTIYQILFPRSPKGFWKYIQEQLYNAFRKQRNS